MSRCASSSSSHYCIASISYSELLCLSLSMSRCASSSSSHYSIASISYSELLCLSLSMSCCASSSSSHYCIASISYSELLCLSLSMSRCASSSSSHIYKTVVKCIDCCDWLSWQQAKASSLQACVVIIRIMRDLCQRVAAWKPLTDWVNIQQSYNIYTCIFLNNGILCLIFVVSVCQYVCMSPCRPLYVCMKPCLYVALSLCATFQPMELIVEKAINSCFESIPSPGDALRRVMECIASGILLPGKTYYYQVKHITTR